MAVEGQFLRLFAVTDLRRPLKSLVLPKRIVRSTKYASTRVLFTRYCIVCSAALFQRSFRAGGGVHSSGYNGESQFPFAEARTKTMMTSPRIRPTTLFLTTAALLTLTSLASAAEDLSLWYDKPATNWEQQALPIGNGRLGAMIFGGVPEEHIQFNEESFWIGDEKDTGAYQNAGDLYVKFDHGPLKELPTVSWIYRNGVHTVQL